MAVPSNIVLNPSSSLDTNLPTLVNVQGQDIFERPNYTDRYLFDPVDSKWNGGALQTDAFIDQGFLANGVDAWVNLDSYIPTITDFFAVSFWVRFPTGVTPASADRIFLIGDGNYNIPLAIQYNDSSRGFYAYAYRDFPNAKVTDSRVFYTQNQWYHIFAYIDTSSPSIPLGIYVDGSNSSSVVTGNPSYASMPNRSIMRTGGYSVGGNTEYGNAEINDLYISTDRNILNNIAEYSNRPTTLLDLNDVSPSRYISYTEYEVTAPSMSVGVKDFDITNSSGTGSTTFEVIQANTNFLQFF